MSSTIVAASGLRYSEDERHAALAAYAILDSEREPEFDDIVAMAARACDVPIAYINLLDGQRQWLKAEVGAGLRELPTEPVICSFTFAEPEILEIPDVAADPRFSDRPLEIGGARVRFYAGVALRTPSGLPIGTLCVADHRPRRLGPQQVFILEALARSVIVQLELRKALAERDRALADREAAEAARRVDERRSRLVLDSAIDYAIVTATLDGRINGWSEGARLMFGWSEPEMRGEPLSRLFTPEDAEAGVPEAEMREALRQGRAAAERWHRRSDGERFWTDGEMMALREEDGAVSGFVMVMRDRTERRRTERRLRESRERFDAALASELLGFLDWDAESALLRGDRRFADFLGLDPEAAAAGLRPDAAEAHLPLEDRAKVRAAIRRALAAGEPFTAEFRVTRPEGEPRWLLFSGHAYRATALRPLRFSGVLVDITASRRAEAALRKTEVASRRSGEALAAERDAERIRLEAVLASAPVGIIFAEASGRIVGQNREAGRILRHEMKKTDTLEEHGEWVLFTPEGDRLPTERYPLVRALTTGEASDGEEYLYRRGDDTLGWVQLNAAPIRDAAGTISGGVVTVDDIDARKNAEAALRRMNETLEATVAERTRELERIWRHARDLLCIARFNGTFFRINPAWVATLGWTMEEMLERPFLEFVHPDDRERTTAVMDGLARGEDVTGFENRYLHRDGGVLWFSWNAVPHEGLIYAVVRDITAEKESAAALVKAEEQLRQSQKMEAVGQLTGGIAHDFNNLLTGITGALEMLQRRIAQGRLAEVERYTGVALASAGRAAALTHRLLAFSRRQPLDPRPTDANELVRSIEDLLRRTIGEAIALDVALEPHMPAILCDPHQLENALINLVINARDAMPGGGRLAIETAAATAAEAAADEGDGSAAGGFVRLTVRDSGTGMPPEVVARAFDPFFTTKPMGQGTGLGLSMIYGFVKQSDGHVRIDSVVGRGTAVSLYLPVAEGLASEAALPPVGEPRRASAGETVLVVEDERSVRELVAEVLADLGYRALQAVDGAEGLRVLQSAGQIDLLVTDVGLPGMNGRQLAAQARMLRPGLKVLFITGYAEDAIFGESHLDPGMQMLPKPFSIDALAGRLREMIGTA